MDGSGPSKEKDGSGGREQALPQNMSTPPVTPSTEMGSSLARPAYWASDIAKFLESGKRARARGLGPRKTREPERVVSWGMVGIKKSCEMKFQIPPLTCQVT